MLPADQLPRFLSVVYYEGAQQPPAERDMWRRGNLPDGWVLSTIWTGGEHDPKQANFTGDKAGLKEAFELLKDATAAAFRDGYLVDYRIQRGDGTILVSSE